MINYSDEAPHTATVAEHAEALMLELREFCSTHNNFKDYLEASYYIKETAEMLEALNDRNMKDIITITLTDWAGFIAQDEEN